MSIKNKGERKDAFKPGSLSKTVKWFDIQKSPQMFANSDEFRKMQNRNRKHK